MPHGDEHLMDGGITSPDGTRTDVYLKECGPGRLPEESPFSLSLIVVTGNACIDLVDCPPEEVEKLGRWLTETAREIIQRQAGQN